MLNKSDWGLIRFAHHRKHPVATDQDDLPLDCLDDEVNMRGIRMKMREKCLKLYNNRKFKDFQLPVLDQPLPDKMRAAYKECVAHPMDLATLLWEIDRQIVAKPGHEVRIFLARLSKKTKRS